MGDWDSSVLEIMRILRNDLSRSVCVEVKDIENMAYLSEPMTRIQENEPYHTSARRHDDDEDGMTE